MNVNVWDVVDPIQRLIRDRVAVDDRRLADPDVALDTLASCSTAAREAVQAGADIERDQRRTRAGHAPIKHPR
jgi:hypothetical protein